MLLCDIVLFALSHVVAYFIRFDFFVRPAYMQQIWEVLVWLVPLKFIVFLVFGLYRGMWRYTSVRDFWLIAQATFVSSALVS